MDLEREITDAEGTVWVCVQAFSGLGETTEAATAAAERVATTEGAVAVVCTPRGGAQSVRLELPKGWAEELDDDELQRELTAARDEG
jgi:hypothetical protein